MEITSCNNGEDVGTDWGRDFDQLEFLLDRERHR